MGLVLSIAPLLGWDTATIHASVNALWMHAIDQVPQFAQSALESSTSASASGFEFIREAASVIDPTLATSNIGSLAANTGGLASHTGGLAAHSGGLAAKFAAAASHTGGFA